MTKDDVFPLTQFLSSPEGLDEAIQRVSSLGADNFMRLVGSVYGDVGQLCSALRECRCKASSTVILDSGRIKTHMVDVVAAEGSEYRMVVNAWGSTYAQIVNCNLTKAGGGWVKEDKDALQEVVRG